MPEDVSFDDDYDDYQESSSSYWYTTYSGEEIEVDFRGYPERCDYGVPRSPVWTEMTDISVEEVRILGIAVPFETLPKELQKAILDLQDEVEWLSD